MEITVVHVLGVFIAFLSGASGYLAKTVFDHSQRIATLEATILERRKQREDQEKQNDRRWEDMKEFISREVTHLNEKIEGLSEQLNRMALPRQPFNNRVSGQWATQPQP